MDFTHQQKLVQAVPIKCNVTLSNENSFMTVRRESWNSKHILRDHRQISFLMLMLNLWSSDDFRGNGSY